MPMPMEQFDIQSNIENLEAVDRFVYELCDEKHILNYYATLVMPVLQGVRNAIVHGNQCDESKRVSIACGNCMGGVFFQIHDEGRGFDYAQYGDLPADSSKGDGIFMMRMLSDNMVYTDGGATLRLEFHIEGIETATSVERASRLNRFFANKQVLA